MPSQKYSINLTITGSKSRGFTVNVTPSKSNSLNLSNVDSETFARLLSKMSIHLVEKYSNENPDIDKLDLYNDIYEDFCERLNDSYERSVTRDTLKWAMDNKSDQIKSVMGLSDFMKFLEGVDNED